MENGPPRDDDAFAPADLRVVSRIAEIDAAAWDRCAVLESPSEAADSLSQEEPDNPFLRHAFLVALEESGSACPRTGWHGAHVVAHAADGTLVGAVPAWLKTHSQGEYVFDHAWADAYERNGRPYYPKLQIGVPFTPATGPRLLVHPRANGEAVRAALIAGLRALRREAKASSIHVTFTQEQDQRALTQAGFLPRVDTQFHWIDEHYGDFDGFLAALSSRKRKLIRRERRDALASGLDIVRLTGDAITPRDWDDFFAFYMDTGSRKWGRPYLTRDFYACIAATMADRIALVLARRNGRNIAGAINFTGRRTLFGRHWGCIEHHPFLHFEVCYYQAIDHALVHGLTRVEAGAQGEHKLLRGYRPVTTTSAHDIPDPAFRAAIADYLRRERAAVDEMGEELAAALPFRDTIPLSTCDPDEQD
jgi:predicted N-acyltransferase